jgi:ABC-2 type transport system ATP-binding protein
VLARLGLSAATGSGSAIPGSGVTGGEVLYAPLPAAAGNGAVAPEAVVAALVAAGVRVRGFATEQVSLEDRFVALTGEGFDVVQ